VGDGARVAAGVPVLTASSGPPLVSAHRGGAEGDPTLENSLAAIERSISLGVEFVEFDVQRCWDGALVVSHGEVVDSAGVLTFGEVLAALKGRAKAHIDLKFTSPAALYAEPGSTYEVAAVRAALAVLPANDLVVTTLEDQSVRAIRDWADAELAGEELADLLVGLSLGRDVRGRSRLEQLRVRSSEAFPTRRMRESRANLVVVERTLARLTVLRWAQRHQLPVLVWTVDDASDLRRLLRDRRVWLVATNFPSRALALRRVVPRRQ
jgi:glycerophosphoryl diester phosphodiesterase